MPGKVFSVLSSPIGALMVTERFLLITAQGREVMEFESTRMAYKWAQERKDKAQGWCPELILILIRKTTTVVEEILDYV